MVGADQWFMKEAEASTRAGATWEFAAVRNSLQVRHLFDSHVEFHGMLFEFCRRVLERRDA